MSARSWWILAGAAALLALPLFLAPRGRVPLPAGTRADLIVVEKARRVLTVYAQGRALRTYPVALGRSPRGPKEREGDNRTPEGDYRIDGRLAKSRYHLALHVSYPEAKDVARARASGFPPGGAIMIHGMRNGAGWMGSLHRMADWTRGCIAVTDAEIEELWRIVPDQTPIHIRP